MAPDDSTRVHERANLPSGTISGGPESMIGMVLKEAYRLEGKIGEGGMGVVFRATQINLGRPVAVKMIHIGSRIPANGVGRFFREAKLLSQLHHPNIVQIIDFGTDPGPLHFMVMEYLSGESLDAFVENRPRLAPELVLDVMEQICAGMTTAHAANVIHRDLKPSNIFVCAVTGSPRPIVKILDFGLGKELPSDDDQKPGSSGITREGVMMGTCGFSAPEQLHGGQVNELADIYGLGAILYFLIAGRPPYLDEGFRATLVKQLTDPPDPIAPNSNWPDLPAVESIIRKAMSVRSTDRHTSPAELLADLQTVLRAGDTLSEARNPSRTVETKAVPGSAKRSRRPVVFASLLLLGLVILAALGWRLGPWSRRSSNVPGVSNSEILFGLSGPFEKGPVELGHGMKAGIEARFAAENEKGGVHGRRLRLIVRDDGYDPPRCKENIQKFLDEDKVFAFIGNVGTPTAKVGVPILLREKRLLVAPLTGGRFLRKAAGFRYVFNYRAGYADETDAIVRYLIEQRKLKPSEIAVFAQEDEYGDDGFEGVARALRKYKREKEDILRVGYMRGSTAVGPAIDKVAADKSVKAVVMVATYQSGGEFIKGLRDRKSDVIFTNVSFVGSDALAEKLRGLGPKYTRDVIITQVVPPLASASTGVERFREDMKKHSRNEVPGFVSLEGYIGASILIEGLQAAGEDLTTERLIDALEKIKKLDLGIGSYISFDKSERQGSKKVWAVMLDDRGGYRELEIWGEE